MMMAPPSPLTMPLKLPVALVIVRVWLPNTVVPLPAKLITLVPDVVPAISKLASFVTPLEDAILPEPDKAKVPALMVVAPSKVLALVSVKVPAPVLVKVAPVPWSFWVIDIAVPLLNT
jgi:hypothetical protein